MSKIHTYYFKNFFLLFILTFFHPTWAQNETNYWYFGNNAGMNFSNGEFEVLFDGAMQTVAGCTTASDRDGNLLFYSNGQKVWNKNHQVMENGDGLSGEEGGIQNSIVIPKLNDPNTFYLFYIRENTQSTPVYILTGVYYSEIKFDAAHPEGYVTENKDVRVVEINTTARLSAIHNPATNSVRLALITKPTPVFGITHPADKYIFRIIDVNADGVMTFHEIDIPQGLGSIGAMKFTPNGSYLAFADSDAMKIYFYTYDNQNINLTLDFSFNTIPTIGMFINPYSIEFSADSKMLYYTGNNTIVQVPYTLFGGAEPSEYYIIQSMAARSLQLARNGKIYVAHGSDTSSLSFVSVINRPEKPGAACEYTNFEVPLSPGSSFKGLPNFIASSMRNRIIPSEDDCVDKEFRFELDAYVPINSVLWDFGDGTTSTDLAPTHLFSEAGIHKVSATIMVNNYPVTLYKNVEAYPLPSLDPGQILQQCDTDNDQVSYFNLENIGALMNNPDPEYQYVFYHSMADALNDENAIENHYQYLNQSNPEEIFVKITSTKGCISYSNFFIETTYTELGNISPIYACENSDDIVGNNIGKFDLDTKENHIRQQFGIPANYTITFYPSEIEAQTKLNAIDGRYYFSSTSTVWLRVEDENNGCNGIGSFEVILNDAIEIDLENKYILCDISVRPLTVLDGGDFDAWEWRNNSGFIISTSRFFTLTQIGTYNLTVYKTQNGITCSVKKLFNVVQGGSVQFEKVSTEDNQIFVSVIGTSDYEFSIDGVNYYTDGLNYYTFTDVETGFHVVYVRDRNNCEASIKTEVFLLKFPPYFTPNGDGVNDFWRISTLASRLYPEIEFYIYDRYGKTIKYIDFKKEAHGWDGTYKGKKLPATDYWFKAVLKDNSGKTIVKTGHFSLLR